jgi:hypothetical protein
MISLHEDTYAKVADATGKIMQITQRPNSLSSTVSISMSIMDNVLQKVLQESNSRPAYRQELSQAFEKKDKARIYELVMEVLKD